jgi:hypothetical protein
MLKSIITSDTRIKLLLKFFLNPKTKGYLRQLSTEFNESTNGIRVELNKLEEAKILSSRFEGRNKIYRANSSHPLFNELRNIVLKSTGIDKVISNIIQKVGNINSAFIRGDYAVGNDSGLIELVIIGSNLNNSEIERVRKKTEKLIERKISILLLTEDEYKNLRRNFDKEPKFILIEEAGK